MIISWATTGPAVTAAFLASIVEVVEAFTIVLAVSTVRGWRPALIGTGCGLALLAVLIATLGPLLDRVPIHVLQLVIGVHPWSRPTDCETNFYLQERVPC